MSPQILDFPELLIKSDDNLEEDYPWQVIIFNDEIHSFDEVIFQIQKATGASLQAAFEVTMEIHTKGRAVCYEGALTRCEKIASILREISLHVEVVPTRP